MRRKSLSTRNSRPYKLNRSVEFGVASFAIRAQMADHWADKTVHEVDQDWRKGGLNRTFGTMMIWLNSVHLAEDVESWLRHEARRHLRSCYGDTWWPHIPADIRKAARWRHQLSLRDVGTRRTGRLENLKWLSFGDVIKLIRGFTLDEQRQVLHSSELRPTWWKAALGVKWFRDYAVAHTTIGPGRYAVTRLCTSADRLADRIAPSEMLRCVQFIRYLGTIASDDYDGDPLLNYHQYGFDVPPNNRSSVAGATVHLKSFIRERDPSTTWIATPRDADVISSAFMHLPTIVKHLEIFNNRFRDSSSQ